jgi:hypothetical protein
VDVPPAFWTAFDLAVANSCGIEDPAEARAAFGRELLVHLFALELLLVPRAFRKSSESVNLNIYTQALSTKHAAEARLHRAHRGVQGRARSRRSPCRVRCRGDGADRPRAARRRRPPRRHVDERLRELRQILLGIDLDEPAAEIVRAYCRRGGQ